MGIYQRVIPCLDVDAGRVVKGSRFVDLKDAGDPVEQAVRYDEEGADELVFLDITATSDKRDTVVDLAREVANDVFVPFTVGGGIRSLEDAQVVLDAGADKVGVNSAAVDRPELIEEIKEVLAREVLVVAIDARRRPEGDGWNVFTAGGRIDTGVDAVEWARQSAERGAGEIHHLVEAFEAGADAVLCASIFHYGKYTIGEVKRQLHKAGIHVRL